MSIPDCNRRRFLQAAAAGTAGRSTAAGAPPQTESELLVATLYKGLSAEQKKAVVMPFQHPLRTKVDNNWHVVPRRIGDFYTPRQQSIIDEIFRGLHNAQFVDNVIRHIKEDAGGLANYSAAIFGEPGNGAFQFVLTGRHCTIRCDGGSVTDAAFGGPIFYGHQAGKDFTESPDHPNNVYWYQARRANEVFQSLNGKQRQQALRDDPRREQGAATVAIKKPGNAPAGILVSEMSRDQRKLVQQVVVDLLLPFRKKDADRAMQCIDTAGGVDMLSMAFYKNLDLGSDGVWDVWQLESPTMVWYFRGHPHVHVWVNVRCT